MKLIFALVIAFNILNFAMSAPHVYSKRSAQQMENDSATSSSPEKSSKSNPLQNNKFEIVEADCKSLGNNMEIIDNKEYKISKIGCVYPGDSPIPEDIIQSVYDHFKTRIAQLEH